MWTLSTNKRDNIIFPFYPVHKLKLVIVTDATAGQVHRGQTEYAFLLDLSSLRKRLCETLSNVRKQNMDYWIFLIIEMRIISA